MYDDVKSVVEHILQGIEICVIWSIKKDKNILRNQKGNKSIS